MSQKEEKKILKETMEDEIRPFLLMIKDGIKELKESNTSAMDKLADELKKKSVLEYELEVDDNNYKGEKGDDGITPVKGIEYFDGITPVKGKDYFDGKTPKKGVDYYTQTEIDSFLKAITPIKGKDYFDGENGITPIKGKDYFDGKNTENGNTLSPEQIRSKLESLKGSSRLRITAINGLKEELDKIVKTNVVGIGGFNNETPPASNNTFTSITGSIYDNASATTALNEKQNILLGTSGSVIYYGAGGTPTEDNIDFFWNSPANTLELANGLGGEKVINGNFTGNATGWSLGSFVYSSNSVSKTANGTVALQQGVGARVGFTGIFSFVITNMTAGTVSVQLGGVVVAVISTNGTYMFRVKPTTTGNLLFIPSNTSRLTVDTISFKEIVGGGLEVGSIRATAKQTINVTSNTGPNSATDHMEYNGLAGANIHIVNKFLTIGVSAWTYDSNGNAILTIANVTGAMIYRFGATLGSATETLRIRQNGLFGNSGTLSNIAIAGKSWVGESPVMDGVGQSNINGSQASRYHVITANNYTLGNHSVYYINAEAVSVCAGSTSFVCSDLLTQGDCDAKNIYGCSWHQIVTCSDYNNNQIACDSTSPCVWEMADCNVFNNDQSNCEGNGCSYDTETGDCTGNYSTGNCTGEQGTCNGNASCTNVPLIDCNDFGCSVETQVSVLLPTITDTQINLMYDVKKIGGTSTIKLIPQTGQTFEGAVNYTLTGATSKPAVRFQGVSISSNCNVFTQEEDCTPTGCFWDMETGICGGDYISSYDWKILSKF